MESIPISGQRKAQLETNDVLALDLEQQQALTREEQDIREMLNNRYDAALSGRAVLLEPDDARRELAVRHAAYLQQS